jgi:hypothetical protein
VTGMTCSKRAQTASVRFSCRAGRRNVARRRLPTTTRHPDLLNHNELGLDQYRSPQLDPVAPPRHDLHAGPRLPRRCPSQPGKRQHTRARTGTQLTPNVLIRYSLAAIRGLLAATILARDNIDHAVAIA